MAVCGAFCLQFWFVIKILGELFGNTLRSCSWVRKRYQIKADINGKVIVITGANTGIGRVNAIDLATRGAKVIIGCRDVDKGNKVVEEIRQKNANSNIRVIKLDLSSLASVRKFAQQVSQEEKQIDVLINNAGVMMTPKWQTEDGFEMQFGTNHLGHFLLTLLLLERLKGSPNARIVNVSSQAHITGSIHFDDINLDKNYSPSVAYSQSKLANVLFTRELAHRLSETNIKVHALHPGIIRTDLSRHLHGTGVRLAMFNAFESIFYIDAELGAQTTLYCALEPTLSQESGQYYKNCQRVKCLTSNATDDISARKLWDLSCDLVRLEDKLRLN